MASLNQLPDNFALGHNYPNPFNSSTVIEYSLPRDNLVRLVIYDMLGRKVDTLVDSWQIAGNYTVRWDVNHLAGGVYFYRLEAGEFVQTQRALLLK